MNLPNKITLGRVFLIPIFLIFYLTRFQYGEYIAGAIFIIASLTDFVDGHLARKHNLVTNFGKFIDPLADKLLVVSALICFVERNLVAAWIVIIIIAREFIISGLRLVAVTSGIVIAASPWGKLKTVSQMIMCILLIFNFDIPLLSVLEQVFIYLALILTVISLVDYMYKNRNVIEDGIK
ncbi:MAG: CDP-diacylglycerol--glycerol-3-phosphate 3-phosphatidyltransferase [Clostridiales bacterium]|nr:CDP-diacylglycerol--glycerol-3-phosphate 3-phosphatidyltransferase [Clostridiales bacterium]